MYYFVLVLVNIAYGFTIKVSNENDGGSGEATPYFVPFTIVNYDKTHRFNLNVTCILNSKVLAQHTITATGTVAELNSVLTNQKVKLPKNSSDELIMEIIVADLNTGEKKMEKFKFHGKHTIVPAVPTTTPNSSTSPNIPVNSPVVPIGHQPPTTASIHTSSKNLPASDKAPQAQTIKFEQINTQTSSKPVFPIPILKILPPFAHMDLQIKTNPDSPNLTFQKFKNIIQLNSATTNTTMNFTITLIDPKTQATSAPAMLVVEKQLLHSSKKFFLIMLFAAIAVIVLALILVFITGVGFKPDKEPEAKVTRKVDNLVLTDLKDADTLPPDIVLETPRVPVQTTYQEYRTERHYEMQTNSMKVREIY